MTLETQIFIKASPETVWTVITDIRNASEMIGGIEKIEIVNEPADGVIGLKWKETRMYFGKPATVEKWIVDAVENKFYKTRSEMDGFVFETTMTIAEEAAGVKLSSRHKTRSQGLVARLKSIPMVFFKGVLKKALRADLNDIKTAAEKLNF